LLHLVVEVQVEFVSHVTVLDDFKGKAQAGLVLSNCIVWMLEVKVHDLCLFKLHKCVVVEHIWRVCVLLSQYCLQLIEEFYFDSVVIPDNSDGGHVACTALLLCGCTIFVCEVAEIVALLWEEELGMPPVEISVVIGNVGEFKESLKFWISLREIFDGVPVNSVLLSNWVLCIRVLEQSFFFGNLWLAILLVLA
jgi:hypothetical protein